MSERIVLTACDNLIETVADHLQGKGKDFSASCVVFPGKRPAHFLRRELARRIGWSILPPRIYSVDEFILSLYQQMDQTATKALESIDAVVILYKIHSELKERLGGEHFSSFESFIPVGMKLFGELEELRLANLSTERLKKEISSLTYNRLYSLAEYYIQFYSYTTKNGFITRAGKYSEVAKYIDKLEWQKYSQLIVAGLFKQTHAEKIIFDKIETFPNTLFVFQSDKSKDGFSNPEIQFYKSPDTHGQIFALSAIIKDRLQKNDHLNERSAIILPTSDVLFPLVHQTLSLLPEDDYNIALGFPIKRTPIYGFLHNLMELISTKEGNKYSASKYIKFVLHPYTKNIRFSNRTDVTRILFHGLESMLSGDKSQVLLTLEEVEQSSEVFSNTAFAASESGNTLTADQIQEHLQEIHTHTIRALESIKSLREFAEKAAEAIIYIYERSTARLHPLFQPYAETFLQILSDLKYSLAGDTSFNDTSGYLRFLQQYVAQQEVPFSGTPVRGLQVLGLLETRNLQFDDVYILNVNDHVLPGGREKNTLLPQQLREKLQLETCRDRDDLVEHYFSLLINGAKRVHLFFSESGESTKSRFIEKLLWEKQKQDGKYSADQHLRTIYYNVKLSSEQVREISKSAEIIKVLRNFAFSASSLDVYLRCQIKFFYQYILHLREKDFATDDIDNKDIGMFVHEVLKKFYEPFLGKNLEVRDLDLLRMEQVINELFSYTFGSEPVGTSYLLKRQIQRQLNKLLTEYQSPIVKTCSVIIKELEKGISIRAFDTILKGQIDRIEERGDSVVILDYKTGARPSKAPIMFSKLNIEDRNSWDMAITSLQLPIYLLLYSSHTGVDDEKIIPAYLYLGENRINKEIEVTFLSDTNEREHQILQIKELIRLLVKEILNSDIPFIPPSDLRKTCSNCPFTTICGTTWVVSHNSYANN